MIGLRSMTYLFGINGVVFAPSKEATQIFCQRMSTVAKMQIPSADLEFCQPASLSAKELKLLEKRRKELQVFNQKILEARMREQKSNAPTSLEGAEKDDGLLTPN